MTTPGAFGESFTELKQFDLDPDAVRLLPLSFCRRNQVVVLGHVDLLSTDPVQLGVVAVDSEAVCQKVAHLLGRLVEPVRLNRYEVHKALSVAHGLGAVSEGYRVERPAGRVGPDAPVADLLDGIFGEAVRRGASDIHIESYHDDVDVRLRVDGILHQRFTHLSPDNIAEAISRIKVLASLDIAERRRPQDGRFRCVLAGEAGRDRAVDMRVSIVPSEGGEDVVIRILDPRHGLIPAEELGMSDEMLTRFRQLIANPEGMVLVTGPTGSGKTTTLYAALNQLRDARRKIVSAEDPIEYLVDKINQRQISAQMSMSQLLRALLRQDPDVMLFGEIRDLESAQTAVRAAATGHLVLGTLHTRDAVGAVVRLRGIGLRDDQIGDALLAVVAQRLVRRVCTSCARPAPPTAAEERLFGSLLEGVSQLRGAGCSRCEGTGYKGRTGIFELLLVDEGLQDRLAEGMRAPLLREHVREAGFTTLVEHGLAKVHGGGTTLEELVRCIPYRQIEAVARDAGSVSG